jgi:hypothetical protein
VFLLGLEDSASAATAVLEKILKSRKSVIFSKAKEDSFRGLSKEREVFCATQG